MRIRRHGLFLLLFFCNGLMLSGQDSFYSFLPKQVVAVHLNNLISIDYPALHASYDFRLTEKDYASAELGFIYDFDAHIYKKEEWERGIIGYQMGLGYKRATRIRNNYHLLWGLKMVHQHSKRRIDDWVWRNQNTYKEKIFYRQQLRKYAYFFLYGNQMKISNKWLFSIIMHLGWNYKNFKTDLPADAEVVFENEFLRINPDVEIDGDYVFPEAYFEIRIGRYF